MFSLYVFALDRVSDLFLLSLLSFTTVKRGYSRIGNTKPIPSREKEIKTYLVGSLLSVCSLILSIHFGIALISNIYSRKRL